MESELILRIKILEGNESGALLWIRAETLDSGHVQAHRAWEHMQAGWRGVHCEAEELLSWLPLFTRDLEWEKGSTAGGVGAGE